MYLRPYVCINMSDDLVEKVSMQDIKAHVG